jgi:hypothetical protein
MSKKKISMSFIRDNLDKPKKKRRKKKKVRKTKNEWNTVMDVSIKTLSHQHTISEEEDYIIFGTDDKLPKEVSQTLIHEHQESSQTLKSPHSRQPVVIELTGELNLAASDNTWRGNVVDTDRQDPSQIFSQKEIVSVIEEVHLKEEIRQQLHQRYKKEEQEDCVVLHNAHIKNRFDVGVEVNSEFHLDLSSEVSLSTIPIVDINMQREIQDQSSISIENDPRKIVEKKDALTLGSLMQQATKKMQSMIRSLDKKAQDSMVEMPQSHSLSVLPELRDDDLSTGLNLSIVDSERTDPNVSQKFQPKIHIQPNLDDITSSNCTWNGEIPSGFIQESTFFEKEQEENILQASVQNMESVSNVEISATVVDVVDVAEDDDLDVEFDFDDITEPLEPTDIISEENMEADKLEINSCKAENLNNKGRESTYEQEEYLLEVTIESKPLNFEQEVQEDICEEDICEEYTNDCSMDTIIPMNGGVLIQLEEGFEKTDFSDLEIDGCVKIECTDDFFEKTLEMSLLQKAQDQETGCHLDSSTHIEKKSIKSLFVRPENLKISQGVEAAKKHLDALFQREIAQDTGSDSEHSHKNKKTEDPLGFEGIDEVTEWERTITDIALAHNSEIRHMCIFSMLFFMLGLIPYSHPSLSAYQPWIVGEPLPLLGSFIQHGDVVEGSDGSLVYVDDSEEEGQDAEENGQKENGTTAPAVKSNNSVDGQKAKSAFVIVEETVGSGEVASSKNATGVVRTKKSRSPIAYPESRFPAQSEEIFIPDGSLDYYFTMLSQVENKVDGTVARALVWGDSTIASDGIIKDVRNRMFDEFGDSGPGFLAVHVDPRWSLRRDIYRKPSRGWSTSTIVHGGSASDKYGLAGTVSTTTTDAYSVLAGPKREDGRQEIHRVQVFYETSPKGGNFSVEMVDRRKKKSTKSDGRTEGYMEISSDGGRQVTIQAHGDGDVTIYGVALESDEIGVTWETFGVAGSSVQSMKKQSQRHLHSQIVHRNPSLIVYWTGGNELGYPSLRSSTGKGYKKVYRETVQKLRAGAPTASCLLIGPLDQATRERGEIVSKATLEKLIRFQKEVAEEIGCAYWDALSAMGGKGSFKRWLQNDPPYANSDLAHLTGRGRRVIGETLADMIMYAYHNWKVDNPELQWSPEESIRDYPLYMNFLESLPEDYLPPIQEELGLECEILVRSDVHTSSK